MLLGMMAGCSVQEDQGSTSDSFTVAYLGADALNPVLSQSNIQTSVLGLLHAQLIRIYDGNIQLDAAESYEPNSDYTEYTFHLRDDLKWSDGEPLTAYDFEYGIYCLLAPEMGSPRANGWYMIKNAEAFATGELTDWSEVGVKAIDEKTIVYTLERPLSDFDRSLADKHIFPVRQDLVERIGVDALGTEPGNLLYCGPYVMTSKEGADLILEKNENYWNSAESFPTKTLNFIKVEDPNTQLAMFENHDVDAIECLAGQYVEYLKDYLFTISGAGIELIWFNRNGTSEENAKILQNRNFRLALSYALNRNEVTLAANSTYLPANYVIDPGFNGPNGARFIDEYPVEAAPLEGDPAKAKAYLAAAMEELGISDVSEFPELKIVSFAGDNYKLECETMMNQWKQNLGLDCFTLSQYDVGVAIDTFYNTGYDLFVISWEPDVRPTDILQALACNGEGNPGVWYNEEYEALVKQAVEEVDPIRKAELTAQAHQLFLDDAGIVPVYMMCGVHAVQDYVSGFQTGSIDGYEFDQLIVTK